MFLTVMSEATSTTTTVSASMLLITLRKWHQSYSRNIHMSETSVERKQNSLYLFTCFLIDTNAQVSLLSTNRIVGMYLYTHLFV
jgi:hypothetical protein